MRTRRRKPSQKSSAPKWMVTFSDLVTLILVFFILMFSMSQVDKVKFQSIAESFRDEESFNENPSIVPGDYPNEEIEPGGEESLDKLYEDVKVYLKKNGLEETANVIRDERGVVLVLEEQLLFGSGDASLMPESYSFLAEIGNLFADMPNMIKVEGHTDNVPIQSVVYPSNWELSTARASSVIRYFIDEFTLSPDRFSAVGYADTRPLVPNTTEKNMQKNRRVEIIITDPALINETKAVSRLSRLHCFYFSDRAADIAAFPLSVGFSL
ncbi:flagellar motor protein MotS [Domibacillus epiphyticus]|uniref:Flagellar motor protein MotS n=1 Tax=Domibacillus epiphyticus TaxID=1714355 RepID=A0A1V2A903_9BACI|nr:flagellar motor protein MotS [Domibacillus epiphyticus]OMP67437.1 flagellar motor protein MotS [Domibacillus epiphyticus]